MCKKSNNQVDENKEFDAKLNELKRHPPIEFGQMLPYFKEQDDLFVISYLKSCSVFSKRFFT